MPPDTVGDYALTLAFCTVMWIAGLLVSRRTHQASVMAMRLEVTELERERAVQNERSRIARELHDVVSHGLTVVVVQTLAARGALSDLPGNDASEVDRHMAAVESAAREALADMRRMLGLLQAGEGEEDVPMPPSPRLGDLMALTERARTAGLDVDDSHVDATLRLPVGLELCVYRIVQEALTNALKHAPGERVTVRLGQEDDQVRVDVTNEGGSGVAAASGVVPVDGRHGLIGMRERASAYGGSLRAGPVPPSGFAVRALLPIRGEEPG